MDQCGQLTRDGMTRLEVAESSAQWAIRDFSITIEGQRQKSKHWLLAQKKRQCSGLCDTLIGKDKLLEARLRLTLDLRGQEQGLWSLRKDSHLSSSQGELSGLANRALLDAHATDVVLERR